MPVIAHEGKRLSDVLKLTVQELFDGGYNTDVVDAQEAAATEYEIGTLLGTDGTVYKVSDPAAVDGSEDIAVMVIEPASLEAGVTKAVRVLVRGPATVGDLGLELGDHTLADAIAAFAAMNPPVIVGEQA